MRIIILDGDYTTPTEIIRSIHKYSRELAGYHGRLIVDGSPAITNRSLIRSATIMMSRGTYLKRRICGSGS